MQMREVPMEALKYKGLVKENGLQIMDSPIKLSII